MTYNSQFREFIFESYQYNPQNGEALFNYSFDGQVSFTERVRFSPQTGYNVEALDRALQFSFLLAGVSYYKAFPTKKVQTKNIRLSSRQATFFSDVYKHGLSQYVFENKLEPSDIAEFEASEEDSVAAVEYAGEGTVVLQSGGKDSLLLATLLNKKGIDFSPWYISQNLHTPSVLDTLGHELVHPIRYVDTEALSKATGQGALGGHIPITFVVLSYALIDAILRNKDMVLAAIGHEGEEPHAYIGDYPVTHQWSKTWPAEQAFQSYVSEYIATIHVGSPLRGFSELNIAKLFVENAWQKYGHQFSSCNVANYKLGQDNSELHWCGHCPKCANSFLLFAAFVDPLELTELFGGNLFENESLLQDFKGLLGIDNVMKPFECVGEVDELRKAYELALLRGYRPLPFDVPSSSFDLDIRYPSQAWATEMIQ